MKRHTIYLAAGVVLAIAVSLFVYFYGVPNYTTTKGLTPSQPLSMDYTIHGHSYAFDTSLIQVRQGDAVKITFISDDVKHNLCVENYGCTTVVSGGVSDILSFVADKAGTFAFYSSVDNDRQLGMQGQFVVSTQYGG